MTITKTGVSGQGNSGSSEQESLEYSNMTQKAGTRPGADPRPVAKKSLPLIRESEVDPLHIDHGQHQLELI